jgi:hypothetical protein
MLSYSDAIQTLAIQILQTLLNKHASEIRLEDGVLDPYDAGYMVALTDALVKLCAIKHEVAIKEG